MATTISRTAYNLLVDDDGSGTVGTIWGKSNVDDILDAIDAILAGSITIGGDFVASSAVANTAVYASQTGSGTVTGGIQALVGSSVRIGTVTAHPTELVYNNVVGLSLGASSVLTTTATLIMGGVLRLKAYTVAGLPGGTLGDMAYCTDLASPTFRSTATGGGALAGPVFYNGANWINV